MMLAARNSETMQQRIAAFDLAGLAVIADLSGALFVPQEKMLIVADLHFEKGSAYAARGALLPPYDTAATLARLASVIAHWQPRMVVALGDSFHDGGGPERMGADERAALREMQSGRDWVWIAGNHDPALPANIGGMRIDEIMLGALNLRHEPSADRSVFEIAGHLHPVARLSGRRRCFVSDGHRLVMPAFGAYAGGLNLRDPAIAHLFANRPIAHVMGRDGLYSICASRCIPD